MTADVYSLIVLTDLNHADYVNALPLVRTATLFRGRSYKQ